MVMFNTIKEMEFSWKVVMKKRKKSHRLLIMLKKIKMNLNIIQYI